ADSAHDEAAASRSKKPFKPAGKSGLIEDRKGRRVLVERSGSEEGRARNEAEANGYGPPRRPKRGYHGKRDFKPRDEEGGSPYEFWSFIGCVAPCFANGLPVPPPLAGEGQGGGYPTGILFSWHPHPQP